MKSVYLNHNGTVSVFNAHLPREGTLLEVLEAHGVNWPYLCREGHCGTCECDLLIGEVEAGDWPVKDGKVRPCAAYAETRQVVLENLE